MDVCNGICCRPSTFTGAITFRRFPSIAALRTPPRHVRTNKCPLGQRTRDRIRDKINILVCTLVSGPSRSAPFFESAYPYDLSTRATTESLLFSSASSSRWTRWQRTAVYKMLYVAIIKLFFFSTNHHKQLYCHFSFKSVQKWMHYTIYLNNKSRISWFLITI